MNEECLYKDLCMVEPVNGLDLAYTYLCRGLSPFTIKESKPGPGSCSNSPESIYN